LGCRPAVQRPNSAYQPNNFELISTASPCATEPTQKCRLLWRATSPAARPYSEAQFKTMKYQPGFPARFGSLADARAHCVQFFAWYNQQHRHSGIGMMTPESVHTGRAAEVRKQRKNTLANAFQRMPNRFKHRMPQPQKLPTAAWTNPPPMKKKAA
jgi:hypothetical protein